MMDTTHATRRTPAPPAGPVALSEVADQLLRQAHQLDAGRSGRTLTPGAGAVLKQTVLALTAGNRLHEHRAPGPATIQIILGRVSLGTPAGQLELSAGQWAPIPDEVHDLVALTDAALLLTVATASK